MKKYISNPTTPFELDLMSGATNYLNWLSESVSPFLGKRILEIGSGIGNMSKLLPVRELLYLTEPDAGLLEKLNLNLGEKLSSCRDRMKTGSLDITRGNTETFLKENFDTVVSFNVLEHLEDDFACVSRMTEILTTNPSRFPKNLIIFVPAHEWAYGSLDKGFGHYRRYSLRRLRDISMTLPTPSKVIEKYFNVFSVVPWIIQGRIFKNVKISRKLFRLFDSLCPALRHCDNFLHEILRIPLGQSILFVMQWDGSA